MASFVQRAMMYLGLKDIDDEDVYDGEEEVSEAAPSRVRQSAYPEPVPPRATVATVRPIARDEGASRRRRLSAGRSCGRS